MRKIKKGDIITLLIAGFIAAGIDKALHKYIGYKYNFLLDTFDMKKLLLELLVVFICSSFVYIVMVVWYKFKK
ncbi:hypothetical protein NBE98_17610 [Clostridium swellfunianum]|uniref:hypothetical protein n=1 Tax=Clostridium swellfunianum TaxID=1367462 RepID=UPI00202E1D7D|nr:hypothetical protein [Clostridium swellfunianum]MCM0650186.1 hypothetical protein [Clostridium swellfunianum]